MNKQREPSCILNHEAMRIELRDKGMPAQKCPECYWIINPKKPEDIYPPIEDEKDD